MTLERRQSANDRMITAAQLVGAGRTLGLTDDETLQTRRATLRRQQRERRAQRGNREGNRAAAEAFLAQDDAKFQQKAQADLRELGLGDRAREIDDVAFAFGEDPEYDMYAPDGKDKKEQKYRQKSPDQRMRPQDDGQTYTPEERAYMGLDPEIDDINDPDVARQSGRYIILPDGQRVWEERGRRYARPEDVEGRIDNANPRQREPGGKEQGYRAVNDAVNRLRQAEQYGYENFGAEGPEMERIAREAGKRANEANAVRGDREEARKAVLEDARLRRGDLTESEIRQRVAKEVRNRRPTKYDDAGKVIMLGADEYNPGKPLNVGGMFDRDVEIALQAEAELRRRKADGIAGGPEMRAVQNDARAGREAAVLRDQYGGYFRNEGLSNIGRLVEIKPDQFGGLGKASHDPRISMDFVEESSVNPSSFGYATPLMRDGKPIAYYDQNMVELGNVNIADSANALNAPEMTGMQKFVQHYAPDYGKEGGTTFGYPQVSINEELALLGDRARAVKGLGLESLGNPRNIAEVDQLIGMVAARAKAAGKPIYRRTPEGKNQRVTEPRVGDILNLLGYADDFNGERNAEKVRLANALGQIAMANQSPVNEQFKADYAARLARPVADNVNMNAAELRVDQGTPLARIPRNAKVGKKQVVAGLRNLSDEAVMKALDEGGMLYGPDGRITPAAAEVIVGAREARRDAQQPFMGAIAGEEPERARFIKGKDRGKGEAAMVAQYGARGLAGAEIERRYEEDRAARIADIERRAKPPARPFLDEQFLAEAAQGAKRVEAAREGNELAQLAMLAQDGAKYGRGYQSPQYGTNPFLENVEVYEGGQDPSAPKVPGRALPAAEVGRKLVLPNESELVEPGRFGGGEAKKRIITPYPSSDIPAEDRLISSPIAIEVGRRNKSGGGQVEYTTPGRPADMPTPYVPPTVDGNGAPMPAPKYSSGPNPRQIQPAQVAPSISPDPGVPTGNQAAPRVDAGAPMPARQGPTRPMTADMRDLLFSLDGPYTDRPRSNEYMSSPEGPSKAEGDFSAYSRRVRQEAPERGRKVLDRMNEFRTADKYQRGRRIGYGAAAGLGALGTILNLGNDEEEQEAIR